MMSPSFRRVWISAQLLWSLVVTARRRRGDMRAGIAPSSSGSASRLPVPAPAPMRTIGDEPRRRVDMWRPAAPPSILLCVGARETTTAAAELILHREFRITQTYKCRVAYKKHYIRATFAHLHRIRSAGGRRIQQHSKCRAYLHINDDGTLRVRVRARVYGQRTISAHARRMRASDEGRVLRVLRTL